MYKNKVISISYHFTFHINVNIIFPLESYLKNNDY